MDRGLNIPVYFYDDSSNEIKNEKYEENLIVILAVLPAVIAILEGHNGKVYIDRGDSRLPKVTSVETAQVLVAIRDKSTHNFSL